MRPLLSILLPLALLAGCATPALIVPPASQGTPPITAAAAGSAANGTAITNGTILVFLRHAHFDSPPPVEAESRVLFQVPNGTSRIVFQVIWESKVGAAATIPQGAGVILKSPDGKHAAESVIGPGPLPGPFEATVEAPPGGIWTVEAEGRAPGVMADAIVTALDG
jgi:hypothetical protein